MNRSWLFPALIVALAAFLRSISFLHDDVSWLTMMAEKTLAGETPYIDLIDVNPPASFLIYLPQVVIAKTLGIPSLLIVNVSVLALGLAGVLVGGRTLLRHGLISAHEAPVLAAFALFVTLVLCGDVFAQREHIALIALSPLLAIYAVRASGSVPDWKCCILAGIGGGVALAIKPYFLLPVTLPLLYLLWVRRRLDAAKQFVALENLVMALCAGVYALAVFMLFPAYVERIVPMALDLYQPLRLALGEMLREESSWVIFICAAVTMLLVRDEIRRPVIAILILSGLGFAAGYFVQAKGWPYQAFPAVALWSLAGAFAWVQAIAPTIHSRAVTAGFAIAGAGIVAALLLWVGLPVTYPRLLNRVAVLAPAQPRITAIAETLVGPQLTRLIGGTWVGRVPNQFMAKNAKLLENRAGPELAARLARYAEFDRASLIETIRKDRPDVVLITAPWLKDWAFSYPEIAQALSAYREAEVVDGVGIWLRR